MLKNYTMVKGGVYQGCNAIFLVQKPSNIMPQGRTERDMELKDKMRIVQELVPGKQVTLCHIIANPDDVLYTKLGLDPKTDYTRSAIGVLTISPAESAVIAADIAIKSSGADIGFVDRFTGTLIISGSVSSVESAFTAIREYVINKLGYTCCDITRT